MVVPRAALLSRGLGRTVLRRSGTTVRPQSWKQVGRRTYASGHGQQQSSEIPWIIGSAAVTIPAAGWLLQQGPTKSDHGHNAHGEEHKEEEEGAQESSSEDQPAEESQDDADSDDGKDEKQEDSKEESEESSGDKEEESQDKGKDDYPPPSPGSPGQINWKPGMGKGPGEGQKGERKPSEKKGEKDSQGSHSGAKHPYIDDAEKSKKGAGVTETAKIHGTVDSKSPARGPNTGKRDE